ncbi:Cilia- and flagella-associated protein 61, N-terminal domain,FAD/NAD(P)-binding domain [Cinara cedri]|uniref:Cilia- and flagella-associated protein 61, N-terminal domain,FAD/NAD(P)-binding domain n=1 Tax=Cinara cedri TaxID=506608 RepID=A0A5E4N8H8_9HEMI|nr:Cilia- and flagella-associated protein 61, N-terminal domain,FAD/NAD(P)-binding domain [Cinara cedri]
MDKSFYRRFNATSFEEDGFCWRRAELTDLPKLKEMISEESLRVFGFTDIAQIITENPLSLCQVNTQNEDISIFMSLSGRPNIYCVTSKHWKEWINYFYGLNDAEEYNTLFVHCLLFRCVESLIYLPMLLEMVYVQMPEIENIIIIKFPGTELCKDVCLPFSSISAKNVIYDPEFGRPEILYHTKAFSINKVRLRTAIVDDFIDLRANLKTRLDFLDEFYGEYSLAGILEFPGEGRINFVPTNEVNGLMTITTVVDYSLLDSVFDLQPFAGLIKFKDHEIIHKGILRPTADVNQPIGTIESVNSPLSVVESTTKQLVDKNENVTLSLQNDKSSSDESSVGISTDKRDFNFKGLCDAKLTNIIKDFLKFQEVPTKNENDTYYLSSSEDVLLNKYSIKLNYQNTAFMVELMLIDEAETKKASWDYLVAFFHEFPQYDYCLMNLRTMPTPPEYKKFFCKAQLKHNREYSFGLLYLLHRSSLFGDLSCVMVTKDHLEIMESLIENHPLKNIISNNISKSVFEDTRYKTYIFLCNSRPIGYCVIRLTDEMEMLSSHFDVARYLYPDNGRNHMAALLNLDLQMIFVKNIRCFLRYVMEDSNINCMFYKLYSDPTVMEQHELSYITGIKELIPVKPRSRIQYNEEVNDIDHDFEKFALFHMNMRLCTLQHISIDAKIVVVGASVVALSFLENLLFNSVNYRKSFENIILVSDGGIPYQVNLTGLEDCMIPKVAHYNYECMKSMGINTFIDIIVGTVTAINRADKCITVNGDDSIYYDYLFLFNGEQFTYSVKDDDTKSHKHHKLNNIKSSNNENNNIENLFLLNSENDVINAFNYIKTMQDNNYSVIVYGKYLGSLSVINVLLGCGIDGSRIVYVESDVKKENLQFITSQYIVKIVYEELYNHNIRVYKLCKFEKLTLNYNQTKIQQVTFTSNDEGQIKINCAGLFWFDQKFIKKINWLSLIRSSFKFNGHLVVSSSFETNVESVYAAGPLADVEIGARVADMLMKLLGVQEDNGRIKAKYIRPLSIYCKLPGNYNYLDSAVPGLKFMKCSTKTLKTGNAVDGYFEIIVDNKGNVLNLSCFSKRDFKYLNLINLCGKNVNLFNDMMDRLSTNSIPCFFDYFEQAWSYPLYLDRFWKLLDDILYKFKKKNNKVSELSKRAGLDGRLDRIYTEKLQHILIKFIDDNIVDFPVFRHVRDAVDRINSNDEV